MWFLMVAQAATLQVGPTQPYTTVASALAVAASGDVVAIDPGTYVEDLVVSEDVVLRGSGQGVTILRSGGGTNVVTIDADVRLESLTVDADGHQGVRQRSTAADRVQLVDVEVHGGQPRPGASKAPSAVDVYQAELRLDGCWIHDNASTIGAVGANGGVQVVDSVFEDNVQSGGTYGAGALYLLAIGGQRVRIIDSTFVGNRSESDGGAVLLHSDRLAAPKDRLAGNHFEGNHSDGRGGAVFLTADVSFSQTFYINVVDNLFVGNDATMGGALAVEGTDYGYTYAYTLGTVWVRMSRSTFVDNTATTDGGHVWLGPTSTVESLNVLLAHGKGLDGYHSLGMGSQDHLLLWGNQGADGGGSGWAPGANTTTADPDFALFSDDGDGSNDDLTLQPGSPAIDAGSPACADDADGTPSDIGVLR